MQDAASPANPGVRLDDDGVDPTWAAPGPSPAVARTTPDQAPHTDEQQAPRRRRWLLGVATVLVLALVGTGLWAGGAFGQRTDRVVFSDPGTTLTTGPFELTFTRATVQRKKNYDDTVIWLVRAIGTGRTTGDESVAPNMDQQRGMFAVRAERSALFAPGERMSIGQQDSASAFTPGLAPVPIAVEFELAEGWREDQGMLLVVFEQELRDNSLLKDQEPAWRNGIHYYVYRIPTTRLPDDLD